MRDLPRGPSHHHRLADEGVRGTAIIAERTEAALLLVRIEGVEFTPFSRLGGKVPRRLFPRVRITVLPPRRLVSPEGVTGRARRAALKRALADEMVQSMFATAPIDTTLFDALLQAKAQHGRGHVVADDIDQQPMSYGRLVAASYALGDALAGRTRPGERVGLLLPTSRAALVSFFALQASGRVPAMLNFSTGPAALVAACRAAEVALVVTSRRFVEKARLDALVTAVASSATVVYLEDLRGRDRRGRAPARVGALVPRPAPCQCGAGARPRGGALHLRLRGHPEGRGPEPPQPARQPPSAGGRRGHQSARRGAERAAGLPQLRPDGRVAAAAAQRRAHVSLPVAAPLPHGAGAGLRHQRHDPVRHRYVPGRLRPGGRHLRLLLGALRVCRRRARQGRDAPRLVREVRHPDSRGIRRHRDGAGAGGQHADALPGRYRGTSAARDHAPHRTGGGHRPGRAALRPAVPT